MTIIFHRDSFTNDRHAVYRRKKKKDKLRRNIIREIPKILSMLEIFFYTYINN